MAKALVNIEEKNRPYYDQISNSAYFGGYRELGFGLIFCIAASIGYSNKKKEPLSGKKDWIARSEQIKNYKNLYIFCQALAIADSKELGIVQDEERMFSTIEEYANSGILELHNRVLAPEEAEFSKWLQVQLMSFSEKQNNGTLS